MANKSKANVVRVELFKDNDKYKDDVTIGLNGNISKVQRGMPVEMDRARAEILEHSARQDKETALLISNYEREFIDRQKMLTP